MSKEEKNMKRVISMVLAMVLVLSLAACGSAKGSSPAASDNGNAADTAEKEEKSGTPEAAASEDNKKQQSASGDFDPTMIEAANSNTQAWLDTMAFDDEYIYFTAHYDSYRCRYDGSDVQKLELNLEAPVGADGAVWGYWYKAGFDDAGLFKLDPKTGEMTMAADIRSGNWSFHSGIGKLAVLLKRGSMINVRDLTTEEKTIKINNKESGIRDVPVCI
jgi:predicted small lipoprotein YifL